MTAIPRDGRADALANPTNDAEPDIVAIEPYTAEFTIEGSAAILFHRWSDAAVAEKAAAAKGSKAKKTDNIESYVYRLPDRSLALPAEYVRMSMVYAAKFRQDPRSPRKSAFDLYKAALAPLDELADLGTDTWDYLDQRRVMVQRSAVTRVRPAMHPGWRASFRFLVLIPEYVDPSTFLSVLNDAGRLIGVGDFRPTFGRFQVTKFGTDRG